MTSWGLGAVQNIDKAAMQLWMSYRQFDPEVVTQTVLNAANGDGLPTTVLNVNHRIEQIWMLQVGGKLKF